MSRLSVFYKAKKLVDNKKVKEIGIGNKAIYFQVEVGEEFYRVSVEIEGGIRVLPCTCRYGTYKGIKGYMCSHQLACLLWLFNKISGKDMD